MGNAFSPGPKLRGVSGWTLIEMKPRLTQTGIHNYGELIMKSFNSLSLIAVMYFSGRLRLCCTV
jgi:hypothetical protein